MYVDWQQDYTTTTKYYGNIGELVILFTFGLRDHMVRYGGNKEEWNFPSKRRVDEYKEDERW